MRTSPAHVTKTSVAGWPTPRQWRTAGEKHPLATPVADLGRKLSGRGVQLSPVSTISNTSSAGEFAQSSGCPASSTSTCPGASSITSERLAALIACWSSKPRSPVGAIGAISLVSMARAQAG